MISNLEAKVDSGHHINESAACSSFSSISIEALKFSLFRARHLIQLVLASKAWAFLEKNSGDYLKRN